MANSNGYLTVVEMNPWYGIKRISIRPNDEFCVLSGGGAITSTNRIRLGHNRGAFKRIVRLLDELNAWRITTVSLRQVVEEAARRSGSFLDVSDGSDFSIAVVAENNPTMTVQFYAPHSYASHYSDVKELAAFVSTLEAVYGEVGER